MSSDTFTNSKEYVCVRVQELLTRHKILSAEFLEANYDKVFANYQRLLNSENYVTRRQALKVRVYALSSEHYNHSRQV